jgi:hypothetical protein
MATKREPETNRLVTGQKALGKLHPDKLHHAGNLKTWHNRTRLRQTAIR